MCCDELLPTPILAKCICSADTIETDDQKQKLDLEWCWAQLAPYWICLNLKERTDRFLASVEHLHEIGLCRLAKFLQTERPSKQYIEENQIQHAGGSGCWTAHSLGGRALVSTGKHAGFLEDDFKVLYTDKVSLRDTLLRCIEQKQTLDKEESYDCLMFGGLTMCGFPMSKDTVFAPRVFAACTHAYIATPTTIRILAETPYLLHAIRNGEEEPLDWFYINNLRQHMFVPQLIVQRMPAKSESDVKQQKRSKTLLDWLENHMAEPTLRFLEAHSFTYDVVMLVVLPVILSVLMLMMLWFVAKRMLRYVGFFKESVVQKPTETTVPIPLADVKVK